MNTIQTTPSTISSKNPLIVPSDLPERPKVQTSGWVVQTKVTGENTNRKFYSTTKQTELEGKVSYNSFDSNIKLWFPSLTNREFKITNPEKYLPIKGNLK